MASLHDVLFYFSFCSHSRFNIVGYGCTTCIGNSGPLADEVAEAIEKGELVACGVLSGNRNFEGRIHPLTRANYLASPPLVVAYALAGTVDIDFETEPLGNDTFSDFLPALWNNETGVFFGFFCFVFFVLVW